MTRTFAMVGALALLLLCAGASGGQPSAPPGEALRHIAGSGPWALDRPTAGGTALGRGERTRRWNAQLRHGDDGSLTGDITVMGAAGFSVGKISGQLAWPRVWGTIHDPRGEAVASFEGTIGAEGASGTFTTRDGETGPWEWEVAVPH